MLELIPPTHTTLHRPHLLVYPFLPHSHLSNLLVYPFLLHSHLSNLRVLLSTTSNGPSPLCAMKSKLVSCRSLEHSVFGTIIFEYSSNFSIKGFSLSLIQQLFHTGRNLNIDRYFSKLGRNAQNGPVLAEIFPEVEHGCFPFWFAQWYSKSGMEWN